MMTSMTTLLHWSKILVYLQFTFTVISVCGKNQEKSPKTELPCKDEDCKRFMDLLKQWPPDKPKAAIYYLVQPEYFRMQYLKTSLRSLDKYFNNEFKYPVILFHEADFIEKIPEVRTMTSSRVFFQKVEFSFPSHLTKPVPGPHDIPCISLIGYRHMCRFQAKTFFEEPIVQQLDYYWRLDDDSFLLQPITYDVFRFMQDQGKRYGYIWQNFDAFKCTLGLWEATRTYIAEHNIQPHFFDNWIEPSIYYNNIEISETKLWFSEDYKKFIDYLDRLGGIYYHRWGDAPIKGLAVSIFMSEDETHHFADIGYQHTSFINNPPKSKPKADEL